MAAATSPFPTAITSTTIHDGCRHAAHDGHYDQGSGVVD
ncbi:hypothetical protein I551_0657 [Mycobacterium ulcerans str. Harvey]|uniref:Uncharacterized protein n=1 Tax=Mycobacterium ulcerans str. Harvey TaxID=1299332 RepID=A0ABN0R6V4_MYCUL|nr:hypothetical protein I551_0657 [Mycobacterium ulcerans str. Harvey]